MVELINRELGIGITDLDNRQPVLRDLLSALQKYSEERILEVITGYPRQTGATHLYYSGGAGLHIPTNSLLALSELPVRLRNFELDSPNSLITLQIKSLDNVVK